MLKQIFTSMFNLNFKDWLGFNQIKQSTLQTKDMLVKTFTVQQSNQKKNFASVMQDLKLTEQDLVNKKRELQKLTNLYLGISVCIFIYSLVIAYQGFFLHFLAGLSLTILTLSNCFKYNYLRFQIQHKKLGVSLKEWFTGEFK